MTKSALAKANEALAAVNRGLTNISGCTLRPMIPENTTRPEPAEQQLGHRKVRRAAALASVAIRSNATNGSPTAESDDNGVIDGEKRGDEQGMPSHGGGAEGDVVQRFLSKEWRKVILDSVNSHTPFEHDVKLGGKRARDQYPAFAPAELDAIIRMLSERVNASNSQQTFKDYLRSKERAGYFREASGMVGFVTEKRFRKFASHLDFDVDAAFSALCDAFRKNISFFPLADWIVLACDEGMIVYECPHHQWVVFIPRKPEPWGMRVYIIATVLAHTGRPIVVDIIPDMKKSGEFLKATEVMAEAGRRIQELMRNRVIPRKASLTMDALFSYSDQLKRWLASNIHGTLSMRTDSTLLAALGSGLKPGHHRLFKEGNILITIYRDAGGKNWFGNYSTCFLVKNVRSLSSYAPTERPPRVPPTYQLPFIWFLVHMASNEGMKTDLRLMATFHGMSVTAALHAKPLELVAYITRTPVESLRLLSNQVPPDGPVQNIVARMHNVAHSADRSGETTNVEEGVAAPRPVVPIAQRQRPMNTEENRAMHRKALNTFPKYDIDTTARQRTVNTKQLKQFATALNQTLNPKESREESLTWLMEVEEQRSTSAATEVPQSSHPMTVEGEEAAEGMPLCEEMSSNASVTSVLACDSGSSTSGDVPPNLDEDLEDVVVEEASLAAVKKQYPTKKDIVGAIRSITHNCSVSGEVGKLQLKYTRILKKMHKCPALALKILTEFDAHGKCDTVRLYSNTFNYVDRIDLMMAYLSVDGYFRSAHTHMVILVYMLRLATVQAHSCMSTVSAAWNWDDWDWKKYRQNEDNYREEVFKEERTPIRQFWRDVRSTMLQAERGLREEWMAQREKEQSAGETPDSKRQKRS